MPKLGLANRLNLLNLNFLTRFRSTRKPVTIAPLLPLTFIVGYQADMAYGNKINRIKSEAENILMYERDLIESPLGLPTIGNYELCIECCCKNQIRPVITYYLLF